MGPQGQSSAAGPSPRACALARGRDGRWERAKAEYTARTGLKQKGAPPKPRPIPPKERQRINLTDPDSRPVKTPRGFIQGYTAQAVTTAGAVIVAADVITGGNERRHLGPMARAADSQVYQPNAQTLGRNVIKMSTNQQESDGATRVPTSRLVADVEGNFPELTLEVGRRLQLDDVVVVE